MPGSIQTIGTWHESGGLFGDSGEAIAACIFSSPPTRWSEPVLELSRLVRKDSTHVPLTALISHTVWAVKRTGQWNLLVSFADWTQRHHGGIYQAASWVYGGKRNRRMDGVMINGQYIPGRTCNANWGTQAPAKLTAILDVDVIPHYDEGKHLYWRALNRAAQAKAKRLGLRMLPYPKPSFVPENLKATAND